MNDEQFDDLKQFISATVSQSEARIRQEMRDGFEGVGEAIDNLSKDIDVRLDDHERRITRLEQHHAA